MEAKEAFGTVCARIAEKYADSGWKYAKSSHWMTKKDKNFKYKIKFYTSWYNISDVSVTLYAGFSVESIKTKKHIMAATTSNAGIPKGALHWNVATEDSWDDAINEITEWIDTKCLAYVNEFSNNLEEYVKKVVKEGFFPSDDYIINMEFVLQFGTRQMAEEAALRYYNSLSDVVKDNFKRNYISMIDGGPPADKYGEHKMLNPSEFRTIIENKIVIDLDQPLPDEEVNKCFVIDSVDSYYDKAFETYCEENSILPDKITDEQAQEICLYAGNHIGFFVAWVIKHGFISEEHSENAGINKVKEETMTGTEYLLEYCDGKFWSLDVAESLIPFVKEYYLKNYFQDYCHWVIDELGDLPMEFIGTWEEYSEFEKVLNEVYERFCEG